MENTAGDAKDDLKVITSIARKVIVKMSQNMIPITPENYLVWFEYFIEGNKDLKADIDKILSLGKEFTPSINKKIYDKYFLDKSNKNLLSTHQEIQKILKSVFDEILLSSELTSDYGIKLKSYSVELGSTLEPSGIRTIVKRMIKDTTRASETSLILKTRLEKTKAEAQTLKEKLEVAERKVMIDPLTELNNRKAFNNKIEELYNEFQIKENPFSVVFLDIDFFKKVNDTHGHQVGDEILQVVGGVLKESLKGKDFAARYGGEEFVVLLQTTALENAVTVANNIRKDVHKTQLKLTDTGEKMDRISISLGVSQVRKKDTIDSVLKRADDALYLAKESGRNNVKSENELK